MTYALYEKMPDGEANQRYVFKDEISLFGCRNGWLIKMLKKKNLTKEPFLWEVNVDEGLRNFEPPYPNHTIIIDLYPYVTDKLSLYELVGVYGYSNHEWTPVMLHLRGLFVEEPLKPEFHEGNDFIRPSQLKDEPVFTMLYLKGSVQENKCVGTWTTPGPSSTNSVLLWPETFAYFVEKAKAIRGSLIK